MTLASERGGRHETSPKELQLHFRLRFRFFLSSFHSVLWFSWTCLLLMTSPVVRSAEPGWYPHEGGLLKYRVNIRFGEEPADTMPEGWKLCRVSAVDVDAAGEVY